MAPKRKSVSCSRLQHSLPKSRKKRVISDHLKRKYKSTARNSKTASSKTKKMVLAKESNEDNIPKTIQTVKWDVSTDVIADIFQDLGVGILEDISCDSTPEIEPAPSATLASSMLPKVSRSQAFEVSYILESSSPTFSSASSDFILFKRARPVQSLGPDYFTNLSDEIILHIFKWLPKSVLVRCACVCKRWKQLSYDESLWKRLDLRRKHLQPGVLGRIIDRGVVILRLATAEICSTVFLDFSLSLKKGAYGRYSKLQYVDFSMASVSPASLTEIFSVCAQLKKISLEHCVLNTQVCCEISENKDLETLNLAMCEGLSQQGLHEIVTKCCRLESLNLSWTHLNSDCLRTVISNITTCIKYLNISGCRLALTDDHINTLVQRCPNLVELDLSDATSITSDAIDNIVSGLLNLEHLHLSRCYNIPPLHYLSLSNMPLLRRLECFGTVSDTTLQFLRTNLPNIEINRHLFSTVARPTTGIRRTSIWELRVRN